MRNVKFFVFSQYQFADTERPAWHARVMTSAEFRERLLVFACDTWRFTKPLHSEPPCRFVADQLMRSASSVAANYRAANLARSRKEFLAKLAIVREEADEVVFWLELIQRTMVSGARAGDHGMLLAEAREIVAIVSAAYRTSRERYGQPRA